MITKTFKLTWDSLEYYTKIKIMNDIMSDKEFQGMEKDEKTSYVISKLREVSQEFKVKL